METMNKCLPLVKRSQAEVLILLSEKNIDGHIMSNNGTNSKNVYHYKKNSYNFHNFFLSLLKYLNGVEKTILN